MIPAAPDGAVRLPGLTLRDHWSTVPLDHARPGGERIRLCAREVVATARDGDDLPWLLYLQGGPGGKADRPEGASGWLGRALQDHRVLLLDQRGTGRSSPATARTLLRRGGPEEQAAYLAHFRADSIVRDCEVLRHDLLGPRGRWSVLGQSFGGFCILTYLSVAPEGLAAAYVTGGLPPLAATAEEVYRRTFPRVLAKNLDYHRAFPGDRELLERVAEHLRRHEVRLPDGSRLSVPRLQGLGAALGSRRRVAGIHWLLEESFVDGPDGPELSDTFLAGVQSAVSFATNPLYALLHEAIYAQGPATAWAAHRVRADHPSFDPDARPLLLTGETIYPWQLVEDPALRPVREAGELLAGREDWPALYDPAVLAANDVPVAAAVYLDDMYVDATLSLETAASVRGLRTWVTDQYEHDGVRESPDVLDRLLRMGRGEA